MNRRIALIAGFITISVTLTGCACRKTDKTEKIICSECGVEWKKSEATMLVRGLDTVYFYPEECKYRYLERYGDATCVVCGEEISVTFETEYSIHFDQTYLMCSKECKEKFLSESDKYIKPHENQ